MTNFRECIVLSPLIWSLCVFSPMGRSLKPQKGLWEGSRQSGREVNLERRQVDESTSRAPEKYSVSPASSLLENNVSFQCMLS